MDTSRTYIKMRRKAIPDLGMGTKPEADIMVNAGRDLSLERPLILRVETYKRISDDVWSDLKGDYYCDGDAGACQLERQDQLQDMLPDFQRSNGVFIEELIKAIVDDFYKLERVKSWEQLWLAFVMEKRYSKQWNGDDWIKVS